MPKYRLSPRALRDVADILSYLHRQVGAGTADGVEDRLFAVFFNLGEGQVLGHTRPDITPRRVLFQACKPYMVVFRHSKRMIEILRVFHGSRDIAKLL